jgi:hypothetical protein
MIKGGVPASTRLWFLSALGGVVQYGVFLWSNAILRRAAARQELLARLPLWGESIVAFAVSAVTFFTVLFLAKP